MSKVEREFHDKLYKESLGPRRKIMPIYQVAKEARRKFYDFVRCYAQPDINILDYGCGTGELSFYLAKNGARVVGIDISEEAIRQARIKCSQLNLKNVDFLTMDAIHTEFSDNSFDIVCGISVLHHLDIKKAYCELARILKPGGSAVFLEPLGHNPLINYFRRLTPQLRSPDEHPLLLQDINLASMYFETVTCEYYALFTLIAVPFVKTFLHKPLVAIGEILDKIIVRKNDFIGKFAWQVILYLRNPKKDWCT
ncbi:hypothetical protein DRP04_10980 [Archaeoglobales archaeon]|nr:MAG: hypothetical protein DRP04_10980 [Archaeoglobales archaeon]